MASRVGRHLFQTYGRLPSVWIGMIFGALAQCILKIGIPITTAFWLTELIFHGEYLVDALVLIAALYVTALFLEYLGGYIFVKGTDAAYEHLVGRFHDAAMAKEVRFFRDEKAGSLASLFRNHMDGTINVFRLIRTDIVPTVITTIVPVIVLAIFSAAAASIFALAIVVRAYLSWYSLEKVRPLRKAAIKKYNELSGVMGDQMAHLAIVRASGHGAISRAKVTELAAEEAHLFWSRHRATTWYDFVGNALTALCFVGVLGVIVYLGFRGEEALILSTLAVLFIGQSMYAAQGVGELLQRFGERWEHVSSSLETLQLSEKTHATNPFSSPQDGHIELRGVTFGYSDDKSIFSTLDMHIPHGQHIAVVGENGAGKSTLLNLLMRFDMPQSGQILIGGTHLNEISAEHLYRRISYVPQEPKLFNTTLKENLLFFEPHASDEKLHDALKSADAASFVSELPEGLQTHVGEMGSKLSGGQRQRVALARALLRDAAIYIFDEPTSAMHPDATEKVVKEVRAKLEGRTLILITHSRQVANMFPSVLEVSGGAVRSLRKV